MRSILFVPLMLLTAMPANAIVIRLRDDTSRACYLQTLAQPTDENNRMGLAICGQALKSEDDTHNRVASFVNRADIRLRVKDFNGALSDTDSAIALEPDQAVAYVNRGAGLVGLQRYREAVDVLNKAIAMGVENSQIAYFNRALAKESLGDLLGAYHDYKTAVELDPKYEMAAQELSRFQVTITPDR